MNASVEAEKFRTQYALPLRDVDTEINVDLFAGGGGASTGLEMGLGRPVHIAINHNPAAISMHQPHELYAAQGFPSNYIIDRGHDGRHFTKTEQVHMCGNSVSPPPMAAIARANHPWLEIEKRAAA